MPVRTLGPEGGEFGRGLTSIRERNECQEGCWALKGGGLRYPTFVGEKNETPFLYKGVETFP